MPELFENSRREEAGHGDLSVLGLRQFHQGGSYLDGAGWEKFLRIGYGFWLSYPWFFRRFYSTASLAFAGETPVLGHKK
jgi:hypothetical protein